MTFTLPALPYEPTALEPHLSANTFSFHYNKHHQAYVTNLNNLVKDTPLASASLEDVIMQSAKDASKTGIFNNAAQVWNHTFYWNSMKPAGGGQPGGKLLDAIKGSFGDFAKFKTQLSDAAAGHFGSGWAWLVKDGAKLSVVTTPNAETPIQKGQTPLLTIDVWEHAYYIDYRNARPKFIDVVLDNLVNWDFVNQNLAS